MYHCHAIEHSTLHMYSNAMPVLQKTQRVPHKWRFGFHPHRSNDFAQAFAARPRADMHKCYIPRLQRISKNRKCYAELPGLPLFQHENATL